jgi:signal transduction histidine kinase
MQRSDSKRRARAHRETTRPNVSGTVRIRYSCQRRRHGGSENRAARRRWRAWTRACYADANVSLPRNNIRHRLISIVVLGIVLSALSLIALVRILSVTTEQRLERGREVVREEVERLAERNLLEGTTLIGLRAGRAAAVAALPDSWRPTVAAAVAQSRAQKAPALGEAPVDRGTLVTYARPLADGDIAWGAYLVWPAIYVRTWQTIVIALAIATLLLVVTSSLAVITFQRSASALNRALLGLGKDLATPIPRPTIRELSKLADGIARLAEDLKQSREKEAQLNRELADKERLAALGRVVAGVAHEVRNPLASIKLHLDLAAAQAVLPPEVEKAVLNASSEIERLDRLVADLLVVTGRQIGPLRSVPVGELVRARVAVLAPWAVARRVTIHAVGDATGTLDADAVGRAVDNLLRNAVEAAPADSTVDVEVGESDGGVQVRVSDRGTGVKEERRAELFEPFFTTKPDGTGLGLAISRAIARAHGGELSYARNGEITRFELSLRAAPSSGATIAS